MALSRRDLLALVSVAGASALMPDRLLADETESGYRGPLRLEGKPGKSRVLILGAGLAGLTAAYELGQAGYDVQILEYNTRVGGRVWTIRGGDSYTELGGATQNCGFAPGVYMNAGPWRVSHRHRAFLDYCRRFDVAVEPFLQTNLNGFVHSSKVLGGKPQRVRHVVADFQGYLAELTTALLKDANVAARLSADETRLLRSLLTSWGGLNRNGDYVTGPASARMRGTEPYNVTSGLAPSSTPLSRADVLALCDAAAVWRGPNHPTSAEFQMPLFQPVGGMDMLPKAFAKRVGHLIRFNAKVTAIRQSESSVSVDYVDGRSGRTEVAQADWCLCTLPLSIMSQLPMQVGAGMRAAVDAVPLGDDIKIAMQFKRRFWEQDEAIYGGCSMTDLPIRSIYYPSYALNSSGKGLLYGSVLHGGTATYEFTSLTPPERLAKVLEYGAQIHPQYRTEYENGMAICWYRNPYSHGCVAQWTDDLLRTHYENLRAIDGRILLAGEGVSNRGWQDGTIMSALDAVERLHRHVLARPAA